MFWLFCRTCDSFYRMWGIAQPMDAPTEVTRWNGGTYHGISIALSVAFVIWQGQAPLNIWTCSSSEKYAFGGMFPRTICLSSLLLLLIMTQTPHFHALSHENRWTAGSTVMTAIGSSRRVHSSRAVFILSLKRVHFPGFFKNIFGPRSMAVKGFKTCT